MDLQKQISFLSQTFFMSPLLLKPTAILLFTSIRYLYCSHISTTSPSPHLTISVPYQCEPWILQTAQIQWILIAAPWCEESPHHHQINFCPLFTSSSRGDANKLHGTLELKQNPYGFVTPARFPGFFWYVFSGPWGWTSWDFTFGLFFSFFLFFHISTICFMSPWIDNIKVIVSAYREWDFINKAEVGRN